MTLLLQGLASAWAGPMVLTGSAPGTSREVVMPCHGQAAAADAAIQTSDAHEGIRMSCCDDGGDCTRCNALCGTHAAPLAAGVPCANDFGAPFALLVHSEAVLLGHPLLLLRPPIELHD
ncbi:hypothetical protein AAG565_10400 [Fontimonas sp. SYSU GA230001]|uniref:hypothetical protein n=1 Tax=Fontimonas sp. SYSU GA230001 TaxID=3142450 RepID=UPI0032B54772